MIVNGKIIYRSATDGLYHVQGEGVSFSSQIQAEVYCLTGLSMTEMEAIREMGIQEQKAAKAQAVQEWATRLANLDDFLDVVNARGFGYGQDNEPTDDDLAGLGIVRDDYRNGLMMLLALRKFIEGTATLDDVADRRDVISRLRTDV